METKQKPTPVPTPEPMQDTLTGNWARKQPPALADGTVVKGVNLSQGQPNTILTKLIGKRITFRGCNLVNVAIDPAWTVEAGNTAQVVIPPPPTPEEEVQMEIEMLLAQRDEIDQRLAELGYVEEAP